MTNYEFRERIAKYNAYENHPLKESYLKEKQKVINEISNEKSVKKISIIRLIMIIMIFVYLILFVNSIPDGDMVCILGIVNIIGVVVLSLMKKSKIKEHKSYKEIIEKYGQQGLVEFSESDVEKGSCYDEYSCCCVTGRHLSVEERSICQKANFHKCKTFMRSAYGYTEEDFDNMEMIHD